MSARYIVGDTREVLGDLTAGSVDCVVTSPPYLGLRSYLPEGHASKASEIGQEDTPADFLDTLLALMDDLWRVLSDDGTFWVNLGDTHAGSGGAGGDYNEGGLRDGQQRWVGSAKKRARIGVGDESRPARSLRGGGWPLDQSVCWVPSLFGASLAYGRNVLNGRECRQWVTRPPVTWCKPNPMPGATGRKFKSATELIVYGGKHQAHYWDVDPVREPPTWDEGRDRSTDTDHREVPGQPTRKVSRQANDKGVQPLNYWVVPTRPYKGSHFAVFPTDLIRRPIIVGCPPGGTVLDPFAGSGTTLMVAEGLGRDSLGIDLDARNLELARERCGMFLIEEAA